MLVVAYILSIYFFLTSLHVERGVLVDQEVCRYAPEQAVYMTRIEQDIKFFSMGGK